MSYFGDKAKLAKQMARFERGDWVRIDIPDESDVDHKQYHGKHGEVMGVFEDDVQKADGSENPLFQIELTSGETVDFREHDLRPAIDEG